MREAEAKAQVKREPVVLVTGDDCSGSCKEALFDGCMHKPFLAHDLRRLMVRLDVLPSL